jgi:uncharacterized protein
MRVWIDLANSPHVPLLEPVVASLLERGDEVLLTARDHAQTVELAGQLWPDVLVLGGASPPGRARKALAIGGRAWALRRFARREKPDLAFSHGSYAQIVAARTAGVPTVTMMDYEYQPANHLSFRLADRIIVPEAFPDEALKRFGARPAKVLRYPGFKEELYLHGFEPDPAVLDDLGLDPRKVIAVFRPPPEGALYHGMTNERFDEILGTARQEPNLQIVLLPRTPQQAERYADGVRIPTRAIDGPSLLTFADVVIGAGGTMNRESALLGTPTYTLFAGRLAAVDAELMLLGLLKDLRDPRTQPEFAKKGASDTRHVSRDRARRILAEVIAALADVAPRSEATQSKRRGG